MVSCLNYIIIIAGYLSQLSLSSRVLELTDRFPEIRRDGGIWLVKFYAPWCGHCKKIEPLWMHVAQALTKTNIRVGRVDVTRFPNVATEFKAYSTPTIKFIKPDFEHTYTGERSKQALINYALRMSSSPVQEIKKAESIDKFKKDNQIFFMYVGEREGTLWDVYFMIARQMQPLVFFYSISEELQKEVQNITTTSAIFVHKEGDFYFYEDEVSFEDVNQPNASLYRWINQERFATFPKISYENIKDLMETKKYIVLAIVDENKAKYIPEEMVEFRNKLETLSRKKRDVYHKHFQFGWMGNTELANSLLMERVSVPYLLVLNSSTFHHHIPFADEHLDMSVAEIEQFLWEVINNTSPTYGGNGFHMNLARKFFDLKRSLEDMWRGNPLLLIVIFSLPSIFLLLIMWACCCADILDADEEEDEEVFHEKKE